MSSERDARRAVAEKLYEEIDACCEVAAGLSDSESAVELQHALGWASGLLAVAAALIRTEDQ